MSKLPTQLSRLGLTQEAGTAPGRPLQRPEQKEAASVFTPLLPTCRVIRAGFSAIQFPGVLSLPNADNRNAVWYGLKRVRVPDDTGQEITLFGSVITLLPTNPNGEDFYTWLGGTPAAAWGRTDGLGAAIVIGKNLPIQLGSWQYATANLPGFGIAGSTPNSGVGDPGPDYFIVQHFPTGALENPGGPTVLNKTTTGRQFSPYTNRITAGDTLDVAFVLDAANLILSAPNLCYFTGFADVQLFIGNTDFGQQFTE